MSSEWLFGSEVSGKCYLWWKGFFNPEYTEKPGLCPVKPVLELSHSVLPGWIEREGGQHTQDLSGLGKQEEETNELQRKQSTGKEAKQTVALPFERNLSRCLPCRCSAWDHLHLSLIFSNRPLKWTFLFQHADVLWGIRCLQKQMFLSQGAGL